MTEEKRYCLRRNDEDLIIGSRESNISTARDDYCRTFNESDLMPFFADIGISPTNEECSGSDYFINEFSLVGTESHKVIAKTWHGKAKRWLFMEAVRDILLPHIGKDVTLTECGYNRKSGEDNGAFNIYLFANTRNARRPRGMSENLEVWGIRQNLLNAKSDGVSEEGYIISDGEFPVAQVIGNSLYIPFGISRVNEGGEENAVRVFRKILEEYVAELTLSPEEKYARDFDRYQESFVDKCLGGLGKSVSQARKKIEGHGDEIAQITAELEESVRKTRLAQEHLASLAVVDGTETARFEAEFDRMIDIHKVINVEVKDEKVLVYTDTIYCRNPETDILHELGRFRIEMQNTDNDKNLIRFFNLDYDKYNHEHHAPHVSSSGWACLGNTKEIFKDLLRGFEFATATMIAVQFLESVNIEDTYGRCLVDFPKAVDQNADRRVAA